MDPEPSSEEIQQLRESVLNKISELGENDVHPKDIARIKDNDQWLRRFLMHHELKQEAALEMVMTVLKWRKSYGTNDINDNTIKKELIIPGGFFPHGRDVDGSLLLIFKCKTYVKNQVETEEIKRCVIYWLERLEREENGKPITLFFDMEGCGLANMDMDFTKYLIGLFKDYYPYFLNYIIIYEMAWILNAAFNIIKSWLPEKAVKKIKSAKKSTLNKWVSPDQALTCWGGKDDYVFSFIPEELQNSSGESNNNNRKVRFDNVSSSGDFTTPSKENALISVSPDGLIKFAVENNEYVSTLQIKNISSKPISFKVKTTTPEKFRVRPGHGCIEPSETAVISITLMVAYKSSNLAKDKFLILSSSIENSKMTSEELVNFWKKPVLKKENQIHLRCAALNDTPLNGGSASKYESDNLSKVVKALQDIRDLQQQQNNLNKHIKSSQYLILLVLVLLALTVAYGIFNAGKGGADFCTEHHKSEL